MSSTALLSIAKSKSTANRLAKSLSAADVRKLAAPQPKRKAASKKTAAKRKTGPRKGKKVAPKYQLKVGKETHKWTGRGRMPLVFREFLEKNGSLDKCLIK